MKPKDKAKLSALEQQIRFHQSEIERLESQRGTKVRREIYTKLEEVIKLARYACMDTLMYALEDVSIEHFGGDCDEDIQEGSWG